MISITVPITSIDSYVDMQQVLQNRDNVVISVTNSIDISLS